MRHLSQPGSSSTSFTTKCCTPWFRRKLTNMGVEEFTHLNSIAENVNFTATTEQDAGKTKIWTVSCDNISPRMALLALERLFPVRVRLGATSDCDPTPITRLGRSRALADGAVPRLDGVAS